MRSSRAVQLLSVILLAVLPHATVAQPNAGPPPSTETVPELRDRLPPQQRQQFDEVIAAFNAEKYGDALALLKPLRDKHPRDPILAKFVSEASLNTGDTATALAILNPMVQASPNDWQAASLMIRACAESGDVAGRDAGIAHMLELRRQGVTPQGMRDFPVEHIKVAENTLIVFQSFEPYGMYKIHALGKLINAEGKKFLTMTLESNDIDQSGFAKEFPKEAAAGMRRFSFDGYLETGLNASGQHTQTHFTYKFVSGQPAYAAIREEFLNIATGKDRPLSSRTGLIVP